ncbi:hypothetical protein K1T71_005750 [Dendrolimus kikuchii]|uniref:Uncharacterized protein n=1 Tax=Dendrolimus kikuchii TaxID=765133 RepID=A0ACC1D589_9NEOP|nr:hypothetical protein K1T71_005750 [Dendrolimus kikuchii]
MENLFEENTFKQYYYQTLSDEESSNIDNLSIVKDSPKQKRKRDEEESLDKFLSFQKRKSNVHLYPELNQTVVLHIYRLIEKMHVPQRT